VENEDDLIKKLKMEWVRERKPVVSDKLREKIEEAIKYVKKGEKVCIIGEAGVGKTTALYLACRDLMKEGTKLRISGIKEEEGVFVVDNIGAKKDTLKKLENCTTPVIASARKSEWENPGRWHEIRIEIEDQRPKLREMFVSMLNANNVKYTEDVVDDILKRFFLPMYLYYIANDFKGREITKKDVSKFPEDVYVYRAEAIRDSRDDLAIALLYCVAKTRTGWLCETQLDILGEILKERIPGLKGDGEYERLLAKFDGSFGIIHEIDRDLMMGKDIPKEATSIIENIGAIRRMRAYDVEKFTKEACARSLNHIGYMDLSATVELMERALENFPDLMKKARKMAEKDKRLLPDLATTLNNLGVALYDKGSLDEAIDKLEEALKIRRDLAEKDEIFLPDLAMTLGILEIVLYDKGSPDKTIERLEDVLKIRRDLAEKDEKFLPDLAGTLNSLGNALYDKGMLDEAVDKLEEALKIRRDLAEKDKRFLPYLATTLNGLETVLYSILNEAVDKLEEDEAIDKLEEALKIRRDLAEKDEIFLPNLAETLNNLGLALYKKGMLDEAMERYDEALKAMEPLSGMPWLWNLISRIHINIAVILLMKNDEKGAAEHLCATLKMLTDERAPKTYDSENLLKTCISYLKGIPKELIPEECRRKLI
jgi:tetratricopeptide (TPR) repeat protein